MMVGPPQKFIYIAARVYNGIRVGVGWFWSFKTDCGMSWRAISVWMTELLSVVISLMDHILLGIRFIRAILNISTVQDSRFISESTILSNIPTPRCCGCEFFMV